MKEKKKKAKKEEKVRVEVPDGMTFDQFVEQVIYYVPSKKEDKENGTGNPA